MSKELLIKMWNNRNPQHEINSDSGEDMFFDTVKMVFEDYIKALSQHDVSRRSEQLKCKCKKAQFTRNVDADFNPLCGRCGKAL